jgi:hypothetical protein
MVSIHPLLDAFLAVPMTAGGNHGVLHVGQTDRAMEILFQYSNLQ